MEIRKMLKSEAKTLKDLAKSVVYYNYTPFLGSDVVNEFIESGKSDKEIDDGVQNCFVAKENTSIIGFIIIKKNFLHSIMIGVEYQNSGYGIQLLNFTEEMLFKRYSIITLYSFEHNLIAIKFYSKNGWVVKEKCIMNGVEMLIMEKSIERYK